MMSSSPSIVEIGKGDTVSFVQLPGAGGCGDIHEIFSVVIAKQHVGNQRPIRGVSGAEVNIQKAVVVHVAEVRAHGHEDLVQPDLCGHVLERAVPHVLVELQSPGVVRKAEIGTHGLIDREEVAGDEQIGPAIVVVIEEPGGETLTRGPGTPACSATSVKVRSWLLWYRKLLPVQVGNVEVRRSHRCRSRPPRRLW